MLSIDALCPMVCPNDGFRADASNQLIYDASRATYVKKGLKNGGHLN